MATFPSGTMMGPSLIGNSRPTRSLGIGWLLSQHQLGLNGDAFMHALIGRDDLFEDPPDEGHPATVGWPSHGAPGYSDQAWYGHEAPQAGSGPQSWGHYSSPPPQQGCYPPPAPAPAYPAYHHDPCSQHSLHGSSPQQAFWAQPPQYEQSVPMGAEELSRVFLAGFCPSRDFPSPAWFLSPEGFFPAQGFCLTGLLTLMGGCGTAAPSLR